MQRLPMTSLFLLLLQFVAYAVANSEGDALNSQKHMLIDPSGVLASWDPLVSPCTWFHVTCNGLNSIVRVDLGKADLSGTLVSALGELTNLQYLEFQSNNISGEIPKELGNLTQLVSLDLFQNNFTGKIPDTLGKLSNLRFLRLNNNSLSGEIPYSLTNVKTLQVLDFSYNNLSGQVPTNGSFSRFTAISFEGNDDLCGTKINKPCHGSPPYPPPPASLN